jgi:TldD protein
MGLISPNVVSRALERALYHGGDFAEVYAEDRQSFVLSLDDRRIERPRAGREAGVSIRVVAGDSTYFGYVDGLGEQDILRVAASVASALRQKQVGPAALDGLEKGASHPVITLPSSVEPQQKAQLLRLMDERAREQGSEVTQVSSNYAESHKRIEVFDSNGMARADERTRVRIGVQVVAKRGQTVETGHDTRGGHGGLEVLEPSPEQVAETAARKALTMLDAVDAPTGQMPVVVGNGFGGVLLHEAVGHGLEADAVQKQASVYAGRLGQQICQPFVNAFDDGYKRGAWGSDGIDDEGAPTQTTAIISEGSLTSFLYDRLRGNRDGVASTGNGRRESFRHLPVPRMTNTYFAPGESRPEDLIADTTDGLYAVSFGGGQVEPATGDFVFGVSEGYLIEGGRITSPVRGATLIGNGVEALQAVDAIADDLKIATGYCGKAGQRVAAGVGQPHVRLRALTVGGTSA